MYLYYCKHRECVGHIKSWERCNDRLAESAVYLGPSSMAIFRATRSLARPNDTNDTSKARDKAAVGQEPMYGSDVTWV